MENFRAYRDASGRPAAHVFDTDFLLKKAEFAKQIMLQWAAAGFDFDEADEVPTNSEDVAKAACDLSEALFKEFKNRDWVLVIPTPEELKRQLDEQLSAQQTAPKDPSLKHLV